ncbi:ROK family transcriptional regulator [Kribbella deserti]|uniref:ROK family protein n=1 Tax=Kribbella deserti TaxID=1926257 RepID=A0ABV6QTH9_9ACTN
MGNGADLNQLRRINELAVLSTLREAGELRLAEVAERTGLARASVGEVVRELLGRGWLAEHPPVVSGRGRPAHQYAFRADAGKVLGLDIGAHSVRAVVADLDGTVLGSARRATTPELSRRRRLTAIDKAIQQCLHEAGASPTEVWGAVAGSTGTVHENGQVVLSAAIADWAGVDLVAFLRERLPQGVIAAQNDSRLCALAEHRRGAGRGAGDLVVLQAGRRTGLGLMVGGRQLRGFNSCAGDLSLLRTLHWEEAIGHLQHSGAAPATGATADPVADTLNAATEGVRKGLDAAKRYARDMAAAAGTVCAIIDPEVLVLSGSLADHGELLAPMLQAEISAYTRHPPQVRVSPLAGDSPVLGAVTLAADNVEAALLNAGSGPLGRLECPAV